jgi:hypothetical protein
MKDGQRKSEKKKESGIGKGGKKENENFLSYVSA